MHPPLLKPLPVIFVAVRDLSLIVSGRTRHRCKALGFEGMRFKWDRDRQQWRGPLTLRNLAILDRWPEVELSAEAREHMEKFREAAAKRKQYLQQKARA
ncbi:Uncharacterised protein [uncultured archaeon]|nr:Uncharacterised protein [uncultured archaeon]